MSNNAVATRVATPNLPAPNRVGQATAVEQSRAVAEVQAAIVVAQQCPRSIQAALREMEASCSNKFLAERAFFRFRRGTGNVSGESVHLARELARCFGNVQYGLHELRRDDDLGQSEMQAWAWDVQMNTRASTTFIVPHVRDTKTGGTRLTDMRDIYENNANMGARRLREMIFSILPQWFIEQAKNTCTTTLEGDGSEPIAQRIAKTVKAFEELDVSRSQMEHKLGRRADDWSARDIAQFGVIYKSIQRGEVNREDEFPAEDGGVTSAEVARPVSAPPAQQQPEPPVTVPTSASPEQDRAAEVPPINRQQQAKMQILFKQKGLDDRDQRLAYVASAIGREVPSSNDLTKAEASIVLDRLAELPDLPSDDPAQDPS